MNRLPLLLAALLCTPLSGFGEEKNTQESVDRTRPAEQILGFWKIVKGINQGEEMSREELEGSRVLVKRYMMITYDRDQKERYRATFKIDDSKKPMHINMTSMVEGRPPVESVGIIKIDKDRWMICYALPGEPRPEKFESTEDGRTMLFVHEPTKEPVTADE